MQVAVVTFSGSLIENDPHKLMYFNTWWCCLGRIKKCGLIGGGVSLGL